MPAEHLDALEADLVVAGWSWDDVPHRLPWRAVIAFADNLGPLSALRRVVDPDAAGWADPAFAAYLLTRVEYQTRHGNWMQSRDGQRKSNRPEPIPTPWDKPSGKTRVIGGGAIPISQWDDFWGDGD